MNFARMHHFENWLNDYGTLFTANQTSLSRPTKPILLLLCIMDIQNSDTQINTICVYI